MFVYVYHLVLKSFHSYIELQTFFCKVGEMSLAPFWFQALEPHHAIYSYSKSMWIQNHSLGVALVASVTSVPVKARAP